MQRVKVYQGKILDLLNSVRKAGPMVGPSHIKCRPKHALMGLKNPQRPLVNDTNRPKVDPKCPKMAIGPQIVSRTKQSHKDHKYPYRPRSSPKVVLNICLISIHYKFLFLKTSFWSTFYTSEPLERLTFTKMLCWPRLHTTIFFHRAQKETALAYTYVRVLKHFWKGTKPPYCGKPWEGLS